MIEKTFSIMRTACNLQAEGSEMKKADIESYFAGNYEGFYSKYLPGAKPLKNNEWQALCPFHEDSNPSLTFNIRSGLHHCFGCGSAGDIFEFYGKQNGLDSGSDFPKILEGIASEFGISDNGNSKLKATIEKYYSYTDETGNLLFQAVRFNPKDFRQRHRNGNGWGWNLEGVRRVIYNLPAVLKASEVLVVEGEKDCDNLTALGLVATCNPMGAGKWRPEYSESLRGKDVVLVPDNDQPGREHMVKVAQNLQGISRSVKWLDLPGLPEKGDVSDFISTFNDPVDCQEKLAVLIAGADVYEPPKDVFLNGIELISLADVAKAEIEEKPLIEGLAGENESVIFSGPSGVGKSLIANYIALVGGMPGEKKLWGLFPISRPLRTLIVQSENCFSAQNKRLKLLFNAEPELEAGSQNVITTKVNNDLRMTGVFTDAKFQDLLMKLIEKSKCDLLMLDPLISFHDGDENDNRGMRTSLDCLTMLCDKMGIAHMLFHHFNRLDETRGASAIRDWAANMFLIKPEKRLLTGGRVLRIVHDKSRNYEQVPDFYLERTPDLNFLRTEKPQSREGRQVDAVVSCLFDLGGSVESQTPLKIKIMEKLNCSDTGARRAITQALELGKIIIVPGTGKGNPTGYRVATIFCAN